MEDTQRDEQNETTFGEICRIIFKKIWIVLGVPVLAAAVAALILGFWLNPSMRDYTMEFVLVSPAKSASVYPDGSPFFYRDIVSPGFLAEAKSSDEEFSKIDIEKLGSEKGGIAIEADEKEGGRYTVRVEGSYFSDKKQAENFIFALANVAVSRMRTMADEMVFVIDEAIFSQVSFEDQLSLLASDKEAMLKKYDEWIERYSDEYKVTVGGETKVTMNLRDFRATVSTMYGTSTQEELENSLRLGGYYNGNDVSDYADRLREEYWKNKNEIEELKSYASGGGAGSSVTVQRLVTLVTRNNDIKTWLGETYLGTEEKGTAEFDIEAKGKTLTKANIDSFAERINQERKNLEKAAETLTAVTSVIYRQGMSVRFDEPVSASGGVGVAVGTAVVFVVAFLLTCLGVYLANKYRKPKEGNPEEEQPRDTE